MADENSTTVIQNGQLAVATVAQTGDILTGTSTIDTTAVVQTADGPQLCVKTVDLNSGGGGGGYVLPAATSDTLGGIKVGENLTVEADGTLNAQAGSQYELPPATAETLGGIKVGQNLTVEADGTLNAQAGGGSGADTSLSNITNDGKQVITEMAAPSAAYDELSWTTDDQVFTAPADGWVVLFGITVSRGEPLIYLCNNGETYTTSPRVASQAVAADALVMVQMPVKSGDRFACRGITNLQPHGSYDYYNLGLKFFYLEGNKSEQVTP